MFLKKNCGHTERLADSNTEQFTAHDAGHRGITHNFVVDSLIGIFIGNFCSGLSIGWWKSSHNVHHFVTNDPVCSIALHATSVTI